MYLVIKRRLTAKVFHPIILLTSLTVNILNQHSSGIMDLIDVFAPHKLKGSLFSLNSLQTHCPLESTLPLKYIQHVLYLNYQSDLILFAGPLCSLSMLLSSCLFIQQCHTVCYINKLWSEKVTEPDLNSVANSIKRYSNKNVIVICYIHRSCLYD